MAPRETLAKFESRSILACVVLLIAAACVADEKNAGVTDPSIIGTSSPYIERYLGLGPGYAKSLDDKFADIGRVVPGFAGAYFEEGVVTVALVDDGQRELARSAIASFLGTKSIGRVRGVHPEQFRFVPARYSFLDLKTWYDNYVKPAFLERDVISTDIDEQRNIIVVGVRSANLVTTFRERFERNGIPPQAVEVIVKVRELETTTLRDYTDTFEPAGVFTPQEAPFVARAETSAFRAAGRHT